VISASFLSPGGRGKKKRKGADRISASFINWSCETRRKKEGEDLGTLHEVVSMSGSRRGKKRGEVHRDSSLGVGGFARRGREGRKKKTQARPNGHYQLLRGGKGGKGGGGDPVPHFTSFLRGEEKKAISAA